MSNGISIALFSYNGSGVLDPTLQSLSKIIIPNDLPSEFILLNNGSTDSTLDKFNNFKKRNSAETTIISTTQSGIAEARWDLIKSAKYDIIFFVEDDNIIEPLLPYTSWLLFDKNPKIFAVGCNTLLPIGKSKPQDFKVVESAFAIGKQDNNATNDVTTNRGFAWGAGLSVRKNRCLELYNSGVRQVCNGRLKGNDAELCYMLKEYGGKIFINNNHLLYHNIKTERFSKTTVFKTVFQNTYSEFYLLPYHKQLSPSICDKSALKYYIRKNLLSSILELLQIRWLISLLFKFFREMSYSDIYLLAIRCGNVYGLLTCLKHVKESIANIDIIRSAKNTRLNDYT